MTAAAVRLTLAPLRQNAAAAISRWCWHLLVLLLNGRAVMHGLLTLHLGWEAWRLAQPGDSFQADPLQYAQLIAHGGEGFWCRFLALGAVAGLIGLLVPRKLTRIPGAVLMGVVEYSLAHYLTASGAAPTAGPTYDILTLTAFWLMIAHWLPGHRLSPR